MGTSAIPAAADERRSNDKDPFMVVLIPCQVLCCCPRIKDANKGNVILPIWWWPLMSGVEGKLMRSNNFWLSAVYKGWRPDCYNYRTPRFWS